MARICFADSTACSSVAAGMDSTDSMAFSSGFAIAGIYVRRIRKKREEANGRGER